MPTVPITTRVDTVDGRIETWTPLSQANADGAPSTFVGAGDRVVQVTGTFGTGALAWEGSLNGTSWFPLRDPASVAISFTAAGMRAVLESVPFIRPNVIGADGTTSLTAMIFHRRNNNT